MKSFLKFYKTPLIFIAVTTLIAAIGMTIVYVYLQNINTALKQQYSETMQWDLSYEDLDGRNKSKLIVNRQFHIDDKNGKQKLIDFNNGDGNDDSSYKYYESQDKEYIKKIKDKRNNQLPDNQWIILNDSETSRNTRNMLQGVPLFASGVSVLEYLNCCQVNLLNPNQSISYEKDIYFVNNLFKSISGSQFDRVDKVKIEIKSVDYISSEILISIERAEISERGSISGTIKYVIKKLDSGALDAVKLEVSESTVITPKLTESEYKWNMLFGDQSTGMQIKLYFSPYCADNDQKCKSFMSETLPYLTTEGQKRFWYGLHVHLYNPYGSAVEPMLQNFGLQCAAEQRKAGDYLVSYTDWIKNSTFFGKQWNTTLNEAERSKFKDINLDIGRWILCMNKQNYLSFVVSPADLGVGTDTKVVIEFNDGTKTRLTDFPTIEMVKAQMEKTKSYLDVKLGYDPSKSYKK